ncbi:OmpA family protein [Myroides sp. LJL119]
MKINHYLKQFGLLVVFFATASLCGYAQVNKHQKADQKYENYALIDAIQLYEKAIEQGQINQQILEKLGDSYYFNAKYDQASKWYQSLFEHQYPGKNLALIQPEYYYRYAQSLKATQKYDKARLVMQEFANLQKDDLRSLLFVKDPNYIEKLLNQKQEYQVKVLDINSPYSDYGGVVYQDGIVFTSSRATNSALKKDLNPWTNQAYSSLYISQISPQGDFSQPRLFMPELDSELNDASGVFTQDQKTIYFTSNNAKKNGKPALDKQNTSLLKIFKASRQDDGTWGEVVELPFNSDSYNCAHPALSVDQKWLYFSSDKPSSIGSSDLYRVQIHQDGTYGIPQNLGNQINTPGREVFGFISKDNYLYFSSDGHPGLGGLDVFRVKINPDNTFGGVVNIGQPINSNADDFAIYYNSDSKNGLVSSNRESVNSTDNIYLFEQIPCWEPIKGVVKEKDNDMLLKSVMVSIYEKEGDLVQQIQTDERGYFQTKDLPCDKKYRIYIQNEFYNDYEKFVSSSKDVINLQLDRSVIPVKQDDDLFKQLNLKPIFFEFDSYLITPQASVELSKVVQVLNQIPTMVIQIRSHTDNIGDQAYNELLSCKRAQATKNWIVSQGIAPDRVQAVGLGQREPVVKCNKQKSCSQKDHQLNRRSEFIVVLL